LKYLSVFSCDCSYVANGFRDFFPFFQVLLKRLRLCCGCTVAKMGRKKKKKAKTILPSVDNFVTSTTTEKFEGLGNICAEAEALFTSELLDELQCPDEDMVGMFQSLHPAFKLARFCAVFRKNTLGALLISKLQEVFEAISGEWETQPSEEEAATKRKKALEGLKDPGPLIERCKLTNDRARVTLCRLMLNRIEPDPFKNKLSMAMSVYISKNHGDILSSWVNSCRIDDRSPIGVMSMKFLFYFCRVPELRKAISNIGGAEGFITRFDMQAMKLAKLRETSNRMKVAMERTVNTALRRAKQVETDRITMDEAQTEAMRGLKEGKAAFAKSKKALAQSEKLLKAAKEQETVDSENYRHAHENVQRAEETHILIVKTLGMLIFKEPELQSLLVDYNVFREFLDIVKKERGELQMCALASLGACADQNFVAQEQLRNDEGLEVILSELNNMERSPSHRVLASNVLYQCIDENSENGDYVCALGILPGLCQMLHNLYDNISAFEEKARLNQADSDGSDDSDVGGDIAESEDKEETGDEEKKEEEDPLKSVECAVRILMTCAKSNESRRDEILEQNVAIPLLHLTGSTLTDIALVSTDCLVNLIDGNLATQNTLVENNGVSVLTSLLTRYDANTHLAIIKSAAKALYVLLYKFEKAQAKARSTACLETIVGLLKTTALDTVRMDMNKLIAVATDQCPKNQDEMIELDALPAVVMCAAHSFGTPPTREAAAWAYGCAVENHKLLKQQACRIGGPNVLVALIAEGECAERTAAALAISKACANDILCKQMVLRARGMFEVIKQLRSASEAERCAAALAIKNICKNNAVSVDDFRNIDGIEPLVDMLRKGTHSVEERKTAVGALTILLVGNLKNKERVSQYGGVPALSQILMHGRTENIVQYALIYLTRWTFVKGGQDAFRAEGKEYLAHVINLLSSKESLTQRAACHCSYQIAKGNLPTQLLLIELGIIPILVSMVRPPITIDPATASWCVQAMGEIAQDDNSRDILRRDGAAAALMELGTQAKTEYLRRDASASYAACTTPGWVFNDGSAEFDTQLSISGITSAKWTHGLQNEKRLAYLESVHEDPEQTLSGKADEFIIEIPLPPSKLHAPNSDPNVFDSGIPPRYYSPSCGKYKVKPGKWRSSHGAQERGQTKSAPEQRGRSVQLFGKSPKPKPKLLTKPGSPYVV
jgi:hypothetical protein